ncbi:hypothetical protein J2850_005518 [Azospirillum picis]|uniref:Uncharacterized protein n=1 Tax=Azospirillum picis TaxID=488438 RepID=A0ABU0MSU0_9PROT|nr:hypothetical protein [Azospirillum picis]MDQ0536561.1 hypothetical protein [Azospirillum picis]
MLRLMLFQLLDLQFELVVASPQLLRALAEGAPAQRGR